MQFSELQRKSCLVTGASRGIGAAVARGLGACGARVAVHYRTGQREAETIAGEIGKAANVRPVFAACRSAIRQFRKQGGGGVIINVSSVAARTGGGGGSLLYAGAKAFVSTFSRSLAKEVASDGIRVNVVSPGVIATDMQDRVTTPAQLSAAVASIPMGRVGTPDECVGTFLYLCCARLSGYMTGQVIEVNGGLLMP